MTKVGEKSATQDIVHDLVHEHCLELKKDKKDDGTAQDEQQVAQSAANSSSRTSQRTTRSRGAGGQQTAGAGANFADLSSGDVAALAMGVDSSAVSGDMATLGGLLGGGGGGAGAVV